MSNIQDHLGPGVASLEAVRSALKMDRPVSVGALLARYQEPIQYDEPLVTPDGVALGGHHAITLERNGRFRYHGHMRATGFPSYTFGVRTVIDGGSGVPAVVAASGRVHGTNEAGDREHAWDQQGENPLLGLHWLSLKRATARADLNFDADWFGSVGDVVGFVATLATGSLVGGPAGVCIVLGIHAADIAGIDESLGAGGLVGVAVAGGVLVVFGPGALVPAIAVGAIAGLAVELFIKHRQMTDEEFAFADRVFRGTLPSKRIVLTNLLGLGRRPFTMPTVGDAILVNLGAGFDDPIRYTGYGDADNPKRQKAGQLLIHELTHAWQIATTTFLPGMICGGVLNQATTIGGDMSVYKYGPAGPPFRDFNLEQQASIVDDWFAGTDPQSFPPLTESDENPYFRYVRDNIRTGVP
jgi:hypothetical protein